MMGFILQPACLAQDPGAPSSQGQGGLSDGARQPSAQPSGANRTNRPSPLPDNPARPLFLSGSVKIADGTPPSERVLIERACNGRVRPEGYTDSKGNFSILLGGQVNSALSDASVGAPSQPFGLDAGLQANVNLRDLNGCEIRANLAGFQSTAIVLTSAKLLDASNIGVLYLHRLVSLDDAAVSMTTASAPKEARSAYDKGLENARKQQWPEAEQNFLKAVQTYPRYAVAWYELGRVYQQEKKVDNAERAFKEAIGIDPRFVNPHGQLAFLAAVQSKWDDIPRRWSS